MKSSFSFLSSQFLVQAVNTSLRSKSDEEAVRRLSSKSNELNAAFTDIPLVTPPPTLEGSMRDYQIEGLSWMVNLWNNESTGGILADEMVCTSLRGWTLRVRYWYSTFVLAQFCVSERQEEFWRGIVVDGILVEQ